MNPFFFSPEQPSQLTEQEFDHVKDHLLGLLKNVYQTYREEDFELSLEEILKVFGLEIPKTDPIIQKTNKIDDLLNEWRRYTHSYAKSLCENKK